MTTTPPSPSPPSPTPSHTSPPSLFVFSFISLSHPFLYSQVLFCSLWVLLILSTLLISRLFSHYFTFPRSLSRSLFFLLFSIDVHKTNFQVDSAGPTSKVNIPLTSPPSASSLSSLSPTPSPPTITPMPKKDPHLSIFCSPSL